MIHAFLHWWLDQLAGLVPARWREGGQAGHAGVLLTLSDGAVTASRRQRGRMDPLGRFPADRRGTEALGEEVRRVGGRRADVALGLPAALVLFKPLMLPLLARKNLRQVLELEMEHETPFSADEVIWDYAILRQDRTAGSMDVEMILIPRERVAALQQIAADAGLTVRSVEILDRATPRRVSLDRTASGQGRGPRALAAALVAASALLAVIAVALPSVRLELALTAARDELAALRDKVAVATSLRAEIDTLSRPVAFFARERARLRDPLVVMAALTNALPDDTYLTEFSLRTERATMVGLSPSAATLIPALAAARPLENPTFGAPVVRPDGNKLELFTIHAGMTAADAK